MRVNWIRVYVPDDKKAVDITELLWNYLPDENDDYWNQEGYTGLKKDWVPAKESGSHSFPGSNQFIECLVDKLKVRKFIYKGKYYGYGWDDYFFFTDIYNDVGDVMTIKSETVKHEY